MIDKLKAIIEKHSHLAELMADPDIYKNQKKLTPIAKEHRSMTEIVVVGKEYISVLDQITDDKEILESDDEDKMIPQAFVSNSIVSLQNLDASALFQVPLLEAVENTYKKNDRLLPPLGTKVKLVIEMNRRVHLYMTITGKVQGVGFRYFTERNAKDLGLVGYVKNLPTGQVEVAVEGDKLELDQFVQLMEKGPAIAKVVNVKVQERPLTEQYRTFEIR